MFKYFLALLFFAGCAGGQKKDLPSPEFLDMAKKNLADVAEKDGALYWKGKRVYAKEGRLAFAQILSANGRYLYYVANELKATNFNVLRYDSKKKKSTLLFAEKGLWLIEGLKGETLTLKRWPDQGFTWDLKEKVLKEL